MFDIRQTAEGTVAIAGRLDAASAGQAEAFFAPLNGDVTLDLSGLDYISSAGLGQIFALFRRLSAGGHQLVLTGLKPQVRYVFQLGRLDTVMTIR